MTILKRIISDICKLINHLEWHGWLVHQCSPFTTVVLVRNPAKAICELSYVLVVWCPRVFLLAL